MGLVLWVSKAKCHLSPALSASQQGTGREGEDLKRLIMFKRLDGAWAFGFSRAMDFVADARSTPEVSEAGGFGILGDGASRRR